MVIYIEGIYLSPNWIIKRLTKMYKRPIHYIKSKKKKKKREKQHTFDHQICDSSEKFVTQTKNVIEFLA